MQGLAAGVVLAATPSWLQAAVKGATALGSGLSDLALGLRLRYEFNRQFAPYIGVEWTDTYGDTADYRRSAGRDTSDTQFVAGLRFWF